MASSKSWRELAETPSLPKWEDIAAHKRDKLLDDMPDGRVPLLLPLASEQRDITGLFIEQYLNETTKQITSADAIEIVGKAAKGIWTAKDIIAAFSQRSCLAHKMVRIDPIRV